MFLENLPTGRIYRRSAWTISKPYLMFAWCPEMGYYAYVDTNSNGDILKFKEAFNSANKGLKSKVGDGILESNDLECVRFNNQNKEKKMSKNYIGEYGLVDIRYVDMDSPIGDITDYTFKMDLKLHKKAQLDDTVVVDSKNGMGIGVITNIYSLELSQDNMEAANRATAWVVDIINMKAHIKRIEATERRKFIIAELEERKKAIEEKAVYQMLAATDPTAAKLLKELDRLS